MFTKLICNSPTKPQTLKKAKSMPRSHTGVLDVQLYPFLTSTLHGGEWLASQPGRSTPGTEGRRLLNRKLSGPQCRSGHSGEEKISCPHRHLNPEPSNP